MFSISAIGLVGVPFSFSLIIHLMVFSSNFTYRLVEVGTNFGKKHNFRLSEKFKFLE